MTAVASAVGCSVRPAETYTDPETGLQYLRNRYYDPSTAQFLTRDPLNLSTRSAYGYGGNDPLNMDDPSGLGFGWHSITHAASSAVNKAISVTTGGNANCVMGANCGKAATNAAGICIVHTNCANSSTQSFAVATSWGHHVQQYSELALGAAAGVASGGAFFAAEGAAAATASYEAAAIGLGASGVDAWPCLHDRETAACWGAGLAASGGLLALGGAALMAGSGAGELAYQLGEGLGALGFAPGVGSWLVDMTKVFDSKAWGCGG